MAIDFISTYFPDVNEVDAATLQSARDRLATFIQKKFPDLDVKPTSVFGDLGLSPFAYLVATFEIATGRFMSDLDLEQVANGVIYNCDFVKKFINNFATVDSDTLKSSGVIRLVFCADSTYTIDRRARFLFGTGNEFTLRLANPGGLSILPVGSIPSSGANEYALKQISETEYAIDIGVVGTMATQVNVGTAGTTDYTEGLTDMTAILAVTNFDFGLPSESLATLAAKTRETFYTATMTTRSGSQNFLAREFPDLAAISPIVPGDTAAIRASVNPLGVANGKMDVCVQSQNFSTPVVQTLKLVYSSTANAFFGALDLIEVPQTIESIKYSGDTTLDLGTKGPSGDIEILAQTSDFAKAPMLTSAYSTYEKYWIKINMPTATGGVDLITPQVYNGEQYAFFTVTYNADPLVKVISDTLSSSDLTPVGVDVLIKGFTPIVIDTLLITYTKKPGVTMALETARTEIYNYFRTLGYNKVYSQSKIYDAMFYAGADDVVSITVNSDIQWSIGDKFIPSSVTQGPGSTATVTYTLFNAASASGYTGPANVYNNLSATSAPETLTYSVLEKRNRGYFLPKENILFSEVIM